MNKITVNEIMKKLQEFFAPDEIEWRVGATNKDKTKGLALPYVTNRAIQNRLDEVFGVFGWQNEYRMWKNNSQICGISVWDEEKETWITKWDGADDSDMEGTKGGLSDSMKRAAYQWGIGRYLYRIPIVWMPLKQQGRSYALAEIPKIPDEFLPEAYRGKQGDGNKQSNVAKQNPMDLVFKKVKEAGFTADEMVAIMKREWGKTASSQLTSGQVEQLNKHLDVLIKLKGMGVSDLVGLSIKDAESELKKLSKEDAV